MQLSILIKSAALGSGITDLSAVGSGSITVSGKQLGKPFTKTFDIAEFLKDYAPKHPKTPQIDAPPE